MKGSLLVIEGLDGSGKETQTGLLEAWLRERGEKVRRVSFPDYSQPSSALVKMYLQGEFGSDPADVGAYAASAFYAVDRYASFRRFWQEDYAGGALILADRYVTSNAIYQMTKLPMSEWEGYLDWLADFEYGKLGLPQPDCVLFLDMPPQVSQRLLLARYQGDVARKDIHENHLEFLEQCRKAAVFTAEKWNWKRISCAEQDRPLPIDEIAAKVARAAGEGIHL